jgi:hypothetical protein
VATIAIEADRVPEDLSGVKDGAVPVEKVVFDMLLDLAERIINRTIRNMSPYLKSESVKV